MTTNSLYIKLIFVCLVVLSGCGGGSDLPPLGYVKGKVTLDGKPVPDATVHFRPTAGGRTGTAVTDQDGNYDLIYNATSKGVPQGSCIIRITTGTDDQTDESGKVIKKGVKEYIPDKYNLNSTLTFEVKSGNNLFDLVLTQ